MKESYKLFKKALKNKIPGCRTLTVRGWRIVALNEPASFIFTTGYFDPQTVGFEELNEKDFVKKLKKTDPTALPMFLGIENTLDTEIEKALKDFTYRS